MKKSVSIFTVTLFTIGVIAIFIAGFSGTASATASSSSWANTKLSKEDCMREARTALTNAKFNNISHSASSVVGSRGPYYAVIRVIPEKQMVFIIVVGPDSSECDRFQTYLKTNGLW
jgi:hypothetical protein